MHNEQITCEQFGPVVRSCHDRPAKGDSQSGKLLKELDQAMVRALAMAQRIAKAPLFAIGMTEKSLNRALGMTGFREAVQAPHHTHLLAHQSAATKRLYATLDPKDVVQVAKEKQR